MNDLQLIIGARDGPGVTFGPLGIRESDRRSEGFDFIEGAIDIRSGTDVWRLDGRNGIEPLALAHLRDDLRSLRDARVGRVFFGDHDFGQIVQLVAVNSQRVRLLASSPMHDIWDVDLSEVGFPALVDVEAQIDHIEAELGPLTGHCQGCGVPQSAYYGT